MASCEIVHIRVKYCNALFMLRVAPLQRTKAIMSEIKKGGLTSPLLPAISAHCAACNLHASAINKRLLTMATDETRPKWLCKKQINRVPHKSFASFLSKNIFIFSSNAKASLILEYIYVCVCVCLLACVFVRTRLQCLCESDCEAISACLTFKGSLKSAI